MSSHLPPAMQPTIMFDLSQEQIKRYMAWRDGGEDHGKCKAAEAKTAIGGAFTFRFTPTTLGVITIVECGVCKKQINLTDFENW